MFSLNAGLLGPLFTNLSAVIDTIKTSPFFWLVENVLYDQYELHQILHDIKLFFYFYVCTASILLNSLRSKIFFISLIL